ncbi:MAG TPA: hypothetical protein ENI79_03130 [Rhodospirillales bacterium]|nr:hypothetical protein [Rhodospirillales bacterium]
MTTAVPEITTELDMRHRLGDAGSHGPPALGEFVQCSRCHERCNREHKTMQPTLIPTQYIFWLYCDFCEVGWQTLWIWRGFWDTDTTITFKGEQVPKFLKQLKALVCA